MGNSASSDMFNSVDESDTLRKKAIRAMEKHNERVKGLRQEIIRRDPKTVIIKYHSKDERSMG